MKTVTIMKNDAGQRLDKFLTKAFPKLPKSLQNKYIRIKRIKCNGARCHGPDILKEGDILTLYINDDLMETEESKNDFLFSSDSLDIVYEDENILLVNKPAGLIVHADDSAICDTLINRIKKYLYQSGAYDPAMEQSFTPSLCNRIDRNTCGIVIAAKNADSLRIMNDKIKSRELEKEYTVLLSGIPAPRSNTITHFLKKNEDDNTVQVFDHPIADGKKAVTTYTTQSVKNNVSLVKIILHTGRTHQIRAQMAKIGCPVLGDSKYGKSFKFHGKIFSWQMLCSSRLTFRFTKDAGILNYLNNKSYSVRSIWFIDDVWNNL